MLKVNSFICQLFSVLIKHFQPSFQLFLYVQVNTIVSWEFHNRFVLNCFRRTPETGQSCRINSSWWSKTETCWVYNVPVLSGYLSRFGPYPRQGVYSQGLEDGEYTGKKLILTVNN